MYKTQEVEICDERSVKFLVPTEIKEVISPSQVKDMLGFEFNDRKTANSPLSYGNKISMNKTKDEDHQLKDGHYELNNKILAQQRFRIKE